MSRLNATGGAGFGGPRVVKPQANVYTVLLLVACLFAAAALVLELMVIWPKVKNPPSAPTPGGKQTSSAVVQVVASNPGSPLERLG